MRRRTLLLSGLGGAAALVVGWAVLPPRNRLGDAGIWPAVDDQIGLNGWIKIAADGTVVLAMPRSEMGQGVHTALAMLAAEELDVPLANVRLIQAGPDKLYGNVAMFVGSLPFIPTTASPVTRPGPFGPGSGWSPRLPASSASMRPAARRRWPTPGRCCAWPPPRRGPS